MLIRNNIFAQNKPFEIGHSSDYQQGDLPLKNIIIDYNLIQDVNTVDNPFYMKTWAQDWVYSITGDFAVQADPLFANAGTADFRLKSNSPAIHAGHPDTEYNNSDGTQNTIGAVQGEYFTDYYWWKSHFPPQIQE